MLNERRRAPRQKSLLGGKVIFDNHNCSMDCTVRNFSPEGALIVSTESYRMPQAFDFAIPLREEEFHATIVWRKGAMAGLALKVAEIPFATAARHLTPRALRRAHMKALASGY
jgi:hypothetical protein